MSDIDSELIAYVSDSIGIERYRIVNFLDNFDKYPRCYHNHEHIVDLFKRIKVRWYQPNTERKLFVVALFHDFIYDPKSKTNELDSANILKQFWDAKEVKDLSVEEYSECYDTILDTKTHDTFSSQLSRVFCELDLSGFSNNPTELLKQEHRIRKEYAWVDWDDYKKGKQEFLKKYMDGPIAKENTYIKAGMRWVLDHISTEPAPNIAVYAGSFNPFHVGHKNILDKAEKLFDKVVIAYGNNPEKEVINEGVDFGEGMREKVRREFSPYLNYHQVENFDGSLIDFIKNKSYNPTLVRGLRNTTDLQQEMNMLRWLQELDKGVKIVYLVCDREYEHISSSAIRQAEKFEDLKAIADKFLPKSIVYKNEI